MISSDTRRRLLQLKDGAQIVLVATACRHMLFGFTEVDRDRRLLDGLDLDASTEGSITGKNYYVLRCNVGAGFLKLLEESSVTYVPLDAE